MDASVPAPQGDLAEIFPELGVLRAHARDGDLEAVLELLEVLRARDVVDHTVAVLVLARAEDPDGTLGQALEEHDDDPTVRVLAAARGLTLGDSTARVTAEASLVRRCAEDPGNPTAWYLRLVAARDARLPAGEALRRHDRLQAAASDHVPGRRVLLECLRPRGGGSWEGVLDAATSASEHAPDGSDAHALLAATYLAAWLAQGPDRSIASLRVPGVIDDIERAATRFAAAPCPSRYGWVAAHTDFAVLLGLAGRRASSAGHFRALGAAVDARTWSSVHEHHADLLTIREFALAEGRRR
ncbi:hypothetical protein KC207_02195 [Phycicoccus sp. BSK3Z-2]|uniref:Uncharacterized protein n=1 Tax=Phycicoccus avicenniae TaxID=2828860 RepID=A0A941HYQ7_9MICO|nr:hypothetical protein [Phycicoccus avicenniae]MBR7742102.1 hypothetical protein [Phycicoccus avicenniae]